MQVRGLNRVDIYGFFPNDPADCDCKGSIDEWMKKLNRLNAHGRSVEMERTPQLECPKVQEAKLKGWKRYKIKCKNCNEVMGWLWSPDPSIPTWCDFHYSQWHDSDSWHGCITPHISPIDGSICFECSCGEDTRDFRLNRTLNPELVMKLEQSNVKKRPFGKTGSAFLAVKETKEHGRGSIR